MISSSYFRHTPVCGASLAARSLLCSVPQTPNTVSENASLAKRAFTLLLPSVHLSVLGSGRVATTVCALE